MHLYICLAPLRNALLNRKIRTQPLSTSMFRITWIGKLRGKHLSFFFLFQELWRSVPPTRTAEFICWLRSIFYFRRAWVCAPETGQIPKIYPPLNMKKAAEQRMARTPSRSLKNDKGKTTKQCCKRLSCVLLFFRVLKLQLYHPTSATSDSVGLCQRRRTRRSMRCASACFQSKFLTLELGRPCCVCDCLWFQPNRADTRPRSKPTSPKV